jgi:hypothetical protein
MIASAEAVSALRGELPLTCSTASLMVMCQPVLRGSFMALYQLPAAGNLACCWRDHRRRW